MDWRHFSILFLVPIIPLLILPLGLWKDFMIALGLHGDSGLCWDWLVVG